MSVGIAKSERVARILEREIRQGRMSHGDRLDSEGGLMRRFAVSRTRCAVVWRCWRGKA